MKITMEMSLYNFEAWGGAVDTLDDIITLINEEEEFYKGEEEFYANH